MIRSLRQRVSEAMVTRHLMPPDMAVQRVSEMGTVEAWDWYRTYLKCGLAKRLTGVQSAPRVYGPVFRVAEGAIGNLTIYGMEDRAGKSLPMPVVESFPGSGAEPRQLAAEAPTESAAVLLTFEFCSGGCRVPGM